MKFQAVLSFIFILVLTGITACKKEEQSSKIPNITFRSVNTNSVVAGSSTDTIWIGFDIEDGDADIIANGKDDVVFITDLRDNTVLGYPIPEIEPSLIDPSVPFKASCRVGVLAAFLLMRDTSTTLDSLQFELYMKDAAGNESNRFTTPFIYLTE